MPGVDCETQQVSNYYVGDGNFLLLSSQ